MTTIFSAPKRRVRVIIGTMNFHFSKMHGLGNDFIVLSNPSGHTFDSQHMAALAHRKTGIGFDQALIVEPPQTPDMDFFYRIFNADGSEVEQCGNGARCLAAWQSRQTNQFDHTWRMGSPAGIVHGVCDQHGQASVAMGQPLFEPAQIPFVAETDALTHAIDVGGNSMMVSVVSMGNPHVVLDVADVLLAPVATLGPSLERHPRFPNRVNVGFMQVVNTQHIKLRVFERGVGETAACGTGACAAVAVGRRRGLLTDTVRVDLPGGALTVRWSGGNDALWLSGPTAFVFEGDLYS